jgi:tRNA pseudouridine38-40 synthase
MSAQIRRTVNNTQPEMKENEGKEQENTSVLLLRFEYDGTNYCGMQFQENGISIQQEIEKVYEQLTGIQRRLICAGRTDAGVHGRGQVGHICYGKEFTIPTDRILKAFNSKLPRDIRINGALRCAVPVHARFDALWRRYSYTIAQTESVFTRRYAWAVHYPLDDALLHEGARIFLGRHDFTSFSKLNTSTKSYICTVEECHWERLASDMIRLHIRADRFVYGMVRSLVGTMVDIGRARRTVEEVRHSLQCADRSLNSWLAPPEGLVFEEVGYPPEKGVIW